MRGSHGSQEVRTASREEGDAEDAQEDHAGQEGRAEEVDVLI